MCNENIYEMQIADYYRRIKDGKNEDYCPKCRHLLNEKTCMEKYGVKHPMQNKKIYLKCQNTLEEHYGVRYMQQSPKIKQKTIDNNIQNFGVPYAMMSDDIKQKTVQTCLNKFGVQYPMQNNEVRAKCIESMQLKYGVNRPLQCKEIMNKVKQTNLLKYGTENPMSNMEIRSKAFQTMLKNDNVRTSKPQEELGILLQKIYPLVQSDVVIRSFCLDFVLNINDCKIDIEYDGSYWHNTPEAQRRDLIRDKILQKEYKFKTLRIKSGYLIPDKQQIIDAIDDLIYNNKTYTQIILPDWK